MFLRRRRVWIPALVTVLILGIAALGNQLVRSSAESRIAETFACELKTSAPATAHLQNRWAAVGALEGDLGRVTIATEKARLGGTAMDLTATLEHVTTGGRTSGGNASAAIDYAELQKRLGDDLQLAGNGENLLINTTFGIPVTVYATLAAGPQAVTVTPVQVSALGRKYSIAALLSSPFGKALPKNQLTARSIPLPGLPAGTILTAATPATDGLHLALRLPPVTATPDCAR